MRSCQEPGFIFGWRQINTTVQHGTEEGAKRFTVGILRLFIVSNRMVAEMSGEGAANLVNRKRNSITAG
ncbi:hypothetical protein D3C81_2203020 [compost metagenome]